MRAHPRSRGENLPVPSVEVAVSWLIPAHAGKTCGRTGARTRARAHPRSRGENGSTALPYSSTRGSSPLTRGKPQARCEGQRGHGLIPAHAGKTLEGLQARHMRWAHPRSRGENGCPAAGPPPMRGSSPLTRGKPADRARRLAVAGLIPAHAGKTCPWRDRPRRRRAHPRSRGENRLALRLLDSARGSSPLTRGKRRSLIGGPSDLGLIPAHAGKTPLGAVPLGTVRGSSPLTRGKRGLTLLHELTSGLIPAHAGKTGSSSRYRIAARAHPRSRGENKSDLPMASQYLGSSPLTRGKL